MPAPPAVEPPASSAESAARISALRSPDVGGQHQPRLPRVDDDGDLVLLAQALDEQRHRLLQQRQLVGRLHRPGHVEQEREPPRRQRFFLERAPAQADERQAMLRAPRARPELGRDRERHGALRFRIVVAEVVHELLHAHRVFRRELALDQEAPHVRVGRGVDVDREGRERVLGRGQEGIVLDASVGLGVVLGRRRLDLRQGFPAGVRVRQAADDPADDPARNASGDAARDAGIEAHVLPRRPRAPRPVP
jgi:hypothetical protein